MENKFYWVMLIPSVFMTAVVSSYILVAPEGLAMDVSVGRIIGLGVSLTCLFVFFFWSRRPVQ